MKTTLRAFTLIELLIVVAVLAILAAIAIPNLLQAQTRSKVSRVLADMRTLRTGVEAYATDHNRYPRMTWGDPPFNDLYEGQGSQLQPIWGTLGPWLTTPVAYITKFDVIDPFATDTTIEADMRMFTYHDLVTRRKLAELGLAPGSGFYVPTVEENEFFKRNFGAYAQMSIGPDITGAPFYVQYDPTNGTTSPGNIWISQKHPGQVAVEP